ncbi:MAG TPA: hypothetical protein VN776_01730 [Terracidiphilus sp.]|nr:hypothetical protein [Terracidiphilus sp.]
MSRSPQFAPWLPRPCLQRPQALALCVLVASCLPLRAQNSTPAPAREQVSSSVFPAAPSITAPGSGVVLDGAVSFGLGRKFAASPSAAQPSPFTLSPFGAAAARQPAPAPLFPIGSPAPGLAASPYNPFGASPAPQPSLNQLMRGSSILPLNSYAGSFKPSYQEKLRPAGGFGDLARSSADGLFSTTDLGNGVFLSAGAGFGSHSMAGAPAASLFNSTAGGPRHSGPSVALKLSF